MRVGPSSPRVIVPNLSDPVSQVYMLTADGVSSVVSSTTVLASMVIFTLLYAALGVVWFVLLATLQSARAVRTPVPDETIKADGEPDGASGERSADTASTLSFAY